MLIGGSPGELSGSGEGGVECRPEQEDHHGGGDGVDQRGGRADLREGRREVLRNAEDVGLIEIAEERVQDHVAAEGNRGGAEGNPGLGLDAGFLLNVKELARDQCGDQPDGELQEKGFRRAGDIAAGEVGHGEAHGAGEAAPAAQQQGADDDKGVAEVNGGALGPDGDIDAQELEADVGQRRDQRALGQPQYFFMFHRDHFLLGF